MAVAQDIKDRIFIAAEELFAASEAGEFPNVEAVRQRSRANMNYVVEAMQEWRRHKRQSVQAVREPLPELLQDAVTTLGRGLWDTAQRLANESLDATRSAFEAEKADFAKLSAEQSEAFETLNDAHEKLRGEFIQLQAHVTRMETENRRLADEMRQATEAANIADMRAQEKVVVIERLEEDLARERKTAATATTAVASVRELLHKTEREAYLANARAEGNKERAERAEAQAQEDTQRTREQLQKIETERDKARAEVTEKAVAHGKLLGELEALRAQVKEQMAIIKGAAGKEP